MEELNWKELEKIPVPDGVEERLLAKIDEWDEVEQKKKRSRLEIRKVVRYVSVAASLLLVAGVGWYALQEDEPENIALQDTYQDPEVAYAEAEKALGLLAFNLSRGMEHLEESYLLNKKENNESDKN